MARRDHAGGGSVSGGARQRGHGSRFGRIFDQGDLRYVLLLLLEERPRHGYDVIRALEDRSGGAYSPSPGTVYPTLALLSAAGYARREDGGGGRRVYELTDAGRSYLDDHRAIADQVFARLARFTDALVGAPMREVNAAFRRLERAMHRQSARHAHDETQLGRLRDIVEEAAAAVEGLASPARRNPPSP